VKVEMFSGRTRAQKAALAAGVTSAVVEALGVAPGQVRVKLYEIEPENSSVAGVLGPESMP
jgi:4-oxalocrotonate tautomerase family enzyme